MSEIRRHRSSFDFGYAISEERKTPLGNRLHKKSFSEIKRSSSERSFSENRHSSNGSFSEKRQHSPRRSFSEKRQHSHRRSFSEKRQHSPISFSEKRQHSPRRSFPGKRQHSPIRFVDDDNSYSSVVKRRRLTPHPLLDGYQLVGDSLLLRFAEQVLFEKCNYENGMRYLGLCVSGQTIEELKERVVKNFSPVGEKIILLIGTNNLLQGSSAEDMITSLLALLDLLAETAKRIIILTLPPIPKLENDVTFWYKFDRYNGFLKTLATDRDNVVVEDISKYFLMNKVDCNMDYFERWYDKMQRRPDLIHLNRAGLLRIKTHLLNNKVLQTDDDLQTNDQTNQEEEDDLQTSGESLYFESQS